MSKGVLPALSPKVKGIQSFTKNFRMSNDIVTKYDGFAKEVYISVITEQSETTKTPSKQKRLPLSKLSPKLMSPKKHKLIKIPDVEKLESQQSFKTLINSPSEI